MAPTGRPRAVTAPATTRPVKLFVGGLTRNTTTKLLREHFSKYGRILDCVAMCQADGKPRGFGYVTLDSSAAADQCLGEPQVIDGRVVDMKRAVPAHGKSGAAASRSERTPAASYGKGPFYQPTGAWDAMSTYEAQAFVSQAAVASAWASPWTEFEGLDCLEVLRQGSVPPSPCEALNLLSDTPSAMPSARGMFHHRAPGGGRPALLEQPVSMSAAAPEFVPRDLPCAADEPKKVAMPKPVSDRTRSVLGDITNNVTASDMAPVLSAKDWLDAGAGLSVRTDFDDSGSESTKESENRPRSKGSCSSLPPGLTLPPGLETCVDEDAMSAVHSILSTLPTPTAAAAR